MWQNILPTHHPSFSTLDQLPPAAFLPLPSTLLRAHLQDSGGLLEASVAGEAPHHRHGDQPDGGQEEDV